jgi:hypothetical protein
MYRTIRVLGTGIFLMGMLTYCCAEARAFSLVVGGWSSARVGTGSQVLTADILNQYPGTTFSTTATLTPAYLSTISDLIIEVGSNGTTAISPLSAAEQSALYNFVLNGGTAILYTDNNTFDANAPAVNKSFLAPFGLAATGTLNGTQPSTIVNSSSPVIKGPAGTASSFETDYPGWFSSVGNATIVARLTANTQPDLAVLAPGALGPGSGQVVFFADEGAGLGNNYILQLNALAQATGAPEPKTAELVMGGVAGLLLVFPRRVRPTARAGAPS